MTKRRLLFIERLPSGEGEAPEAPEPAAWIGRALLSKSGRTVYFNGEALKRLEGRPRLASHASLATGALHWVAEPAKDGHDRRGAEGAGGGAGGGDGSVDLPRIQVEEAALEEYLALRGLSELDPATHRVVSGLIETDVEALQALEHRRAAQKPGPADAATRRKRRARARRGEGS